MTAQELLKMIETVDVNDTAKLDEIDARVWCYLNNKKYELCTFLFSSEIKLMQQTHYDGKFDQLTFKPYSRSRDALKQIRPDGWKFLMCLKPIEREWQCSMYDPQHDGIYSQSPMLPTEELAELHAIIQAIDFERTKK